MWVVIALCVLIALTILVLCIPVDLFLRLESWGKPVLRFKVEWLFGRVRKSFRTGEAREHTSRSGRKKKPSEEKEKTGKKRRPSRDAGGLVWRIIHIPGLWQSIERLVRGVFRCFSVRRLSVDFSVGLDDPADTALLVGPASEAVMFADRWSPHSFRLTPVFRDDAVLEGEAMLDIRLYPIRTVTAGLAFLFSPSTVRTVVMLVRWKCRRK